MEQLSSDALICKVELGRRLNVSRSCIDQWLAERLIPAYRLGRHCVRFDYLEVRAALRRFERPALKRFSRGAYRAKKRLVLMRVEQIVLPLVYDDPRQLKLFKEIA